LEFVNHFHRSMCYKVHNAAFLQLTSSQLPKFGGPIAYWSPYSKVVGSVPLIVAPMQAVCGNVASVVGRGEVFSGAVADPIVYIHARLSCLWGPRETEGQTDGRTDGVM